MRYTTFVLPAPVFRRPEFAALHGPDIEADPPVDGVIRVRGYLDTSTRLDIEDALERAGIPFDRFRVDDGTGDDDAGDRRMFRPTIRDGAPQDISLAVSAHDDVLFFLEDWDRVAATPGGPITRAQVEQFLGLTVPPLTVWLRAHPVTA